MTLLFGSTDSDIKHQFKLVTSDSRGWEGSTEQWGVWAYVGLEVGSLLSKVYKLSFTGTQAWPVFTRLMGVYCVTGVYFLITHALNANLAVGRCI